LYTKKKAATFNPYFSLGLQMFISSSILLTITETTGMSVPLNSIPVTSWYAIGYLVIVGSIMSFIAYVYMLQKLPAEISSIYAYINPIVAILLGALLFEETLSGLFMVNKSIRRTRRLAILNENQKETLDPLIS